MIPIDDIQSNPPAKLLGGVLLERRLIRGQPAAAWLCSGLAGRAWDDFLRNCAMGQFQQSSLWAQTKEIDGWKDIRVIIEQEGSIAGGFQVLWKRSRFGRIGYVSKGPVLSSEDPERMDFVLDLLQGLVHSQRLLAIIVQPPDEAQLLPQGLVRRGFLPNRLMNVITATCMVDLTRPAGEWEKGLARSRKHEIRKALRSALTIREGGDSEIPKFFELMAASCARQRVRPNPGSVEALRRLVRLFQSTGEMRLSFADYEGEPIACVMALKFGERVTIWKKGWSGAYPNLHANSLLYYESLNWARRAGFRRLDFAGMGRSRAEHLLALQEPSEKEIKDRDVFHLSFGARPRLLPQALIYWSNPALRFLYSQYLRWFS